MFQGLLNKFKTKKNPSGEFRIPEGRRVYAVGDIHGRADLLEKMHEIIAADAKAHSHKDLLMVYLGDYLDRGPYVRETIDLLLTGRPRGFESVHLMGNHEQILLNFLKKPDILSMWLGVGGLSTLMSYGLKPPGSGFTAENAHDLCDELQEKMPREHLDFITNLRPSHQVGDCMFVHAGIRPHVAMEEQNPEDFYWIRDEFLNSEFDHGKLIIHGHTISENIQQHSNRIGVDTGAYATGILSCAVLEDRKVDFLSTQPSPD